MLSVSTSDVPVGLRHAGVRLAVQALLQLLIQETTRCLFEGRQTHYAKIKQTHVGVPLNRLFLDNLRIFSRLSLILWRRRCAPDKYPLLTSPCLSPLKLTRLVC